MDEIPPELLEDLIAEYKEAFMTLDSDGDGYIRQEDVERLMKTFNQKPTQHEMLDLMHTLDPDWDAEAKEPWKVSFIQFVKLVVLSQHAFNKEEALRSVFLTFDRNGDGNINGAELHYVLKALGIQVSRADAEELLSEFGGVIGFEQFAKVFGRLEV